jgi:hypothetical protein
MDCFDQLEDLQHQLITSKPDPQLLFSHCYNAGFNPLGIGSARIGLQMDDLVSKVAWKESGIISNLIEDRVWNSASEHLQNYLAPCVSISSKSHVLIQKRCLPITASIIDPEIQNMIGLLSAYGITDIAVNLGLYDQRVVCYDYAMIRPEEYPRLFPEVVL